MSATSFTSTLLETPALHQSMFSFPQTLEVSVEDEEGEAGNNGLEGYVSDDRARFDERDGKGQAVSTSTTGKSVFEMKKRFEDTTQEVSVRGNQQSQGTVKRPSIRETPITPKLARKAETLEIQRTSVTSPEQRVSTTLANSELNTKQEHVEELRGLGLDLPRLAHDDEIGSSWQADMPRLEVRHSEPARNVERNVVRTIVEGK